MSEIVIDKTFINQNVITNIDELDTRVKGIKSNIDFAELPSNDWGVILQPIGQLYKVMQQSMSMAAQQLKYKVEEDDKAVHTYLEIFERHEDGVQNDISKIARKLSEI